MLRSDFYKQILLLSQLFAPVCKRNVDISYWHTKVKYINNCLKTSVLWETPNVTKMFVKYCKNTDAIDFKYTLK